MCRVAECVILRTKFFFYVQLGGGVLGLFVFNQGVFFHAERFVRFLESTSVFQFQRSIPRGGAGVVVLGGANFEIESATQESREDFFLFVLEFLLKILGFLIFGLLGGF